MAIVKNGILFSKVNGSIGNVVLTEDKDGRQIAREKASNVFNPQTAKQQGNRTRFTVATEYAKYLKGVLPRFYRRLQGEPRYQNARNRFVSYMMKNVFTVAGSSNINKDLFLAVRGDANWTPPFNIGFSVQGSTIEMAISDTLNSAAYIYCPILFNTTSGMVYFGNGGGNRVSSNPALVNYYPLIDETVEMTDLEEGLYYATLFIFSIQEGVASDNSFYQVLMNPFSTYPQGNTFFNQTFEIV